MAKRRRIEVIQADVFIEGQTWKLVLELNIQSIFLTHELRVRLDDTMRAITPNLPGPPSIGKTLHVAGSLPSPLSASQTSTFTPANSRVTDDGRMVLFTVPREMPEGMYQVEVAFEFRTVITPEKIRIAVTINRHRKVVGTYEFEGMHVGGPSSARANLVDFLMAPGQRFLFARSRNQLVLPYDSLSPILPKVQQMPESTVWGTTWPNEVQFWNSQSGLDFLAHQVRGDISQRDSVPRRIVVSPSGLNVPKQLGDLFLAELDVQQALGIDARIVEPDDLIGGPTGGLCAPLCLGTNLGVVYSGFASGTEEATQARLVVGDDVLALRELYDARQLKGELFSEYRRRHPRPVELDGYVTRRLTAVKARAAVLAGRPL